MPIMSPLMAPPTIETLVFAGLGLGAFFTWIVMRGTRHQAYREGYEHGLAEDEQERDALRARVAHLERDLARGASASPPAIAPAAASVREADAPY
jgi:hypothetical protein